VKEIVEKLFEKIAELIPLYAQNLLDKQISQGNVAICVICQDGNIYGRLYGRDKLVSRRSYQLAWTKASQTWITGMKTGEYEKRLFNNEFEEEKYGIGKPDLIGWEGGQVITLKTGEKLSVGFSGFRGVIDLEIVVVAIEMLNL
jgi:uncharacterized protein GlcG (DUF336 family)